MKGSLGVTGLPEFLVMPIGVVSKGLPEDGAGVETATFAEKRLARSCDGVD